MKYTTKSKYNPNISIRLDNGFNYRHHEHQKKKSNVFNNASTDAKCWLGTNLTMSPYLAFLLTMSPLRMCTATEIVVNGDAVVVADWNTNLGLSWRK